ncbi:MAG: hypothetical protein KKC05_03495 [Nanoarchaeota archaeon]|nr:hypothetical protein [Nanoarchaeota archaeon]
MEDSKIVEINLSGLKDELSKNTDDKFKRIEELLMKREEAQSLSESKSYKPEKFDYRAPLEEMLHSFRSSAAIRHDNYVFRDKFEEDFNKIANTKWNEETRKTDYSLTEAMVEAIGSLNPDCCIPEVWADKIERDHVYPGSVFLGAWFVNWYDDINGRPGDKVHVCRVGPAVCADLSCEEPTTTAATVACPYITLEHDTCAYYICREDIEDVQVGLVDALNEGLGSCLAVCVDNYFFNIALACTNGGTLTHTAEMSGSLLLEAMGSMMAGNRDKQTGLPDLNL